MNSGALQRVSAAMFAVGLALALGALTPTSPQLAYALVLATVSIAALGASPYLWLGGAVVATVSLKALSDLHAIPSIATFTDMFLVWGALLSALLRARRVPDLAKLPVRLLGSLGLVMIASAGLNRTEVLRPIAYFILLGLPFAVVATLLVEPPRPRAWRTLSTLFLAAALIQVPFGFFEFARSTDPDRVQGTLIGAGAGAHVMSAIAIAGAVWLLADTQRKRSLRFILAGFLVCLPFIADAKQVIFAAPVMVVAGNWRGIKDVLFRVVAVGIAVFILTTYLPAGRTAELFVQGNAGGRGGKQAASKVVWRSVESDPAALVFGLGPAESVSRTAFMTTPMMLNQRSPLQILGLSQAKLALEANTSATDVSGGGTSLNTGVSSALGVFGDLGIAGLAVYFAALLVLFSRLRKARSAQATAATCVLALFVLLGLVFDWWEQPPFTIIVGLLVGLALTRPEGHGETRQGQMT